MPMRTRGFTLIESVVALAVAAIALLALLHLQLVSMATADKAQGLTQAVWVAQEKLAEALSASPLSAGVDSGTVAANGDQFTWQRQVSDAGPIEQVPADPAPPSPPPAWRPTGLRQLTVEVTWLKGPGDKHITLTTYVAESNLREPQSKQTAQRLYAR
jgi:general secretion pathway protein I